MSLKTFYAKAGYLNFQPMAPFTLDISMSPWVCGYLSFFSCCCEKTLTKAMREKGFIWAPSSEVYSLMAGASEQPELETAVHTGPIIRNSDRACCCSAPILHLDGSNPSPVPSQGDPLTSINTTEITPHGARKTAQQLSTLNSAAS